MHAESVQPLDLTQINNCHSLSDILHADDPAGLARFLLRPDTPPIPLSKVEFLAPVDQQEVWAAGVTYKRSQVARMEESESGASHYDKVYDADRPELFLKATPSRVSGPGQSVRVRSDSNWSVPEPEFTLAINPDGKIVGYTIGNDMSARDIEGENPLYLPQAKVYRQCAGLGPCVLLADGPLDLEGTQIELIIERSGSRIFTGTTDLGQLHRKLDDLATWLYRESEFPNGAFLMTGTGIVPDDDFTLEDGDTVSITIAGIGTLTNPVVKAK
ncbi:Fumarylacetoacetate (FAA) hydrolase family protein [Fuerstiella marisgermanici]|uniref:Fumarylacetoacetate (FAA) hydrolase family protein n=1 Tax=Fuerstiella marisgermanici TaxID=1891926 RepID=A0A1P8WHJ3_9PLAN|nr:Fumarylacetoacetate (FAA) hydrolase family protein [Fuerstiella marisgermanici]